jgi:5-methylcytosine-specific restriction endonuclease McrA
MSRELTEKLERARDLMSHANPSGDLGLVLERALDLLLEKLEKQRFARTKQPRVPRKLPLEKPWLGRAEDDERGPRYQEAASLRGDEFDKVENARPSASDERGERLRAEPSTTPDPAPRATPRVGHIRGEPSPAHATPRLQHARREHIPNHVRRAVAERDGFQCTYVDDEGRRCPSRAFLELHHERAHALGGPSTLENLRFLCASHNRLLAERDFGRAHQEQFTRREPRPKLERVTQPRRSADRV